MAIPDETPTQDDNYSGGVDMVRLLSREFGSSPPVVRSQLTHSSTQIEIDGVRVKFEDNLFLPYHMVKGKEIVVIGPERHYKVDFKG